MYSIGQNMVDKLKFRTKVDQKLKKTSKTIEHIIFYVVYYVVNKT